MRHDIREVVERVRAIPYGRPRERTPAGVLAENRGTCSTKHALLADLVRERDPDAQVEIVHRVYRLTRDGARRLFGERAAALVPDAGLVDVHTYARVDGRVVDVTFPGGDPWDGESDMQLACGPGDDFPAADKEELVARHCDPAVREPFIAALSD